MRRYMLRNTALLLVLLAGAVVGRADVVTRKSGRPAAGEVTAMTNSEVTVKVKTPKEELVKVPLNDLISIAWEGEPARLNIARSTELSGKYKQALETYAQVAGEIKGNHPYLKEEVEYLTARAAGKLALTDATARDAALKTLGGFLTAHSNTYHFYEGQKLLGDLYAAKGDFAAAQGAYEKVANASWKEMKLEGKVAVGRVLTLQNKLDAAAAAFDAVITEAGDESVSQRLDAMLAKAAVLSRQSKFEEALKELKKVVLTASADDSKLQAEALLRQGECYQGLNKTKDAMFAYLQVDVLFSREKVAHAEALFYLQLLREKLGQPAKAEEARAKLESDHPHSEWTNRLKKGA